jgi:cell division protein FtsW
VLLLLTYSPLGVEINGSRRWIKLFGITFQPSELAKLTLIIVVSDLLSRIKNKDDERKYYWIVMGITAIICGIIFIGNLSTAVILGGIVILLTILARVHIKYWGSTIVVLALFLVLGYVYVNEVYVKPGRKVEGVFKRASVWVARVNNDSEEKKVTDPEFRITDENYQPSHAMIAVARGGKSPFGVLPGNSTERDVLPQAYSDYIFAIIVEEWGIIGSIFLILIYLAILFRACLKSSRYADYSAMMMVMGLALMITCQALISMMVSVGIGPVTGQPLPMISRGGTSVLITSIYFGIIMSVSREQTKLGMLQQETINHSREEAPIVHLD